MLIIAIQGSFLETLPPGFPSSDRLRPVMCSLSDIHMTLCLVLVLLWPFPLLFTSCFSLPFLFWSYFLPNQFCQNQGARLSAFTISAAPVALPSPFLPFSWLPYRYKNSIHAGGQMRQCSV